MSKVFKSFIITLILLALVVIVPACRPKPVQVAPSATNTAPSVPPNIPLTVTTATAQPVTTQPDFVSPTTDTVGVETLPNDIEELNRVAQSAAISRTPFSNSTNPRSPPTRSRR